MASGKRARQHGPCNGNRSPVNSGSGNRALLKTLLIVMKLGRCVRCGQKPRDESFPAMGTELDMGQFFTFPTGRF